jgi:flagellar hook-associated protein 3 FlgL
MSGFRVTQRSVATTVLAGLQHNISRLSQTQQQLSNGKQLTRASDSPGGAVLAMQHRSDMTALRQYSRNATDGMGWLGMADGALTGSMDQVSRVRDLVVGALSSGTSGTPEARDAIALEVDKIRESVLNLANTTYLDRPVFGGTTSSVVAFQPDGTYVGDTGTVQRTVSGNSKVRVDVSADDVFGTGTQQLFTVLSKISNDLRNAPTSLSADLDMLDTSAKKLQAGVSSVGARYNQLTQMQQAADDRVLDLTTQLSDVEDIDLPKTITELSLQQTAYQAALAATARVVQPSLVDFLR